jgi:hypothetical protein
MTSTIHQMFDLTFSAQEKDTIQHIARFWEPRVRDFPPSSYLDHYNNTKAVCDEIAEIKRQREQYRKSMTKNERRECKAYRHRFDNQYHNPTLIEEGLKAWADDCFEPVDLRDNGIIQTEWRATYLAPAPVSYE